MISLNEDGI